MKATKIYYGFDFYGCVPFSCTTGSPNPRTGLSSIYGKLHAFSNKEGLEEFLSDKINSK